jgi:hypothetical protein
VTDVNVAQRRLSFTTPVTPFTVLWTNLKMRIHKTEDVEDETMDESTFNLVEDETTVPGQDQMINPAEAQSTDPTNCQPTSPANAERSKKLRKQRQPRPKLMKWDDDTLKLGLISLVYALKVKSIEIPWAEAASIIDPLCSGAAFEQAVGKIRKKRLAEGKIVPPLPPASSLLRTRANSGSQSQLDPNWPAISGDTRLEASVLGQPSSNISLKRRSNRGERNPGKISESDSEFGVTKPSRKKFKRAPVSSFSNEQFDGDSSDWDDSNAAVERIGGTHSEKKSLVVKLPVNGDLLKFFNYTSTFPATNANTTNDGATGFVDFDPQAATFQLRTPSNQYPSTLQTSPYDVVSTDFDVPQDNPYDETDEPFRGCYHPASKPLGIDKKAGVGKACIEKSQQDFKPQSRRQVGGISRLFYSDEYEIPVGSLPDPTKNPSQSAVFPQTSHVSGYPNNVPAGGFPAQYFPVDHNTRSSHRQQVFPSNIPNYGNYGFVSGQYPQYNNPAVDEATANHPIQSTSVTPGFPPLPAGFIPSTNQSTGPILDNLFRVGEDGDDDVDVVDFSLIPSDKEFWAMIKRPGESTPLSFGLDGVFDDDLEPRRSARKRKIEQDDFEIFDETREASWRDTLRWFHRPNKATAPRRDLASRISFPGEDEDEEAEGTEAEVEEGEEAEEEDEEDEDEDEDEDEEDEEEDDDEEAEGFGGNSPRINPRTTFCQVTDELSEPAPNRGRFLEIDQFQESEGSDKENAVRGDMRSWNARYRRW